MIRKIIPLFFLIVLFLACSKTKETQNFIGYWQNDQDLIFEVFQNADLSFTIQNINGGFQAKRINDTLTGENSLGMPFYMTVKGDSAYYRFGTIITGYQRIDEATYKQIFATQQPAVIRNETSDNL